MKQVLYWLLLGVLVTLVGAWLRFGIIPWASFVPAAAGTPTQKSVVALDNPEYLRQTPYDCGAYNIHHVLQSLGNDASIDSVVEMNNRYMIPRIGVVPEVLVRTLRKNNQEAKLRAFQFMSNEERVDTIKRNLEDGPVIALIQRHGYMHFVVLVGHSGGSVHLYDPMLPKTNDGYTLDNNGEKIGNDSLTWDEFTQLWGEVSVMGFYEYMAVMVDGKDY